MRLLVCAVVLFAVTITASAAQQRPKSAASPVASAQRPKAANPRSTATPKSSCSPSEPELRALAADLYKRLPEQEAFLAALDEAVGLPPNLSVVERLILVHYSEELTILVSSPYEVFRTGLSEAIRKRNPISSAPVPSGYILTVSPSRITSPDIEKVILERDGTAVTPIASALVARELSTRLGAKTVLHAGTIGYPCSAFAPGATVRITAIPASGENIVKTLTPDTIARPRKASEIAPPPEYFEVRMASDAGRWRVESLHPTFTWSRCAASVGTRSTAISDLSPNGSVSVSPADFMPALEGADRVTMPAISCTVGGQRYEAVVRP
ncbi:MAG: hypothetical protein AB7I25_08140 [Vicinamibacterales bacterium]